MRRREGPRVAFVADDLTGATDVLAQCHLRGAEAALVVGDGPLPDDADVVGVAGPFRSMEGKEHEVAVRAALRRMIPEEPDVLLYKVCSTFDSSPAVGSIGRAIELLREAYPAHGPVPVAPAQPEFGRWTAFSEHFAASGGEAYRLDRHPVMAHHPSTPMREADLRIVLAEQLSDDAGVASLQLPAFEAGSVKQEWRSRRTDDSTVAFVVDAVSPGQLDVVARLLWDDAGERRPAIVVGSGGIMAGLARTLRTGQTQPSALQPAAGPVLVVSASASSVTGAQLDDALGHGWVDVPVPASMLADGDDPSEGGGDEAELTETVFAALREGRDTVVHTCRGPLDARLRTTGRVRADHVGALLGRLAARAAAGGLTRDVVVCGGDTSSHALLAMKVSELRVAHQFVTAGPICRTDDASPLSGCRLLLKGGQVGPKDILRRFAGQVPPHSHRPSHPQESS